jgi:hypothetical protein
LEQEGMTHIHRPQALRMRGTVPPVPIRLHRVVLKLDQRQINLVYV